MDIDKAKGEKTADITEKSELDKEDITGIRSLVLDGFKAGELCTYVALKRHG